MLVITGLTHCYGQKLLFDDVTLNLLAGRRYGLLGANGTGKSTFMRLLTGAEPPTEGTINLAKSLKIGWLKQDQFRYEQDRIIDVVIQGKPELAKALDEKMELLTQPDYSPEHGYRLAELEEIILHNDGYDAESVAHTLLTGLGIHVDYHSQPLSSLSGGFKLRVLLAQTLFSNPDVMLLDEPTNHLDIMTIAWLERYLINNYSGLLVFISHDINFVNNLATDILDIDYGEIRHYVGNYNHFVQEKQAYADQKLLERKTTLKRIEHLQSFVDRFKAKASKARQAQSKAKQIERIELPDVEHSSRVSPAFEFQQRRPSGKAVLKVENISKSFGERQVLHDISFSVNRGEKVAIIGHNGIGKSTLLKILLGKLCHDNGDYTWGYETQIAYFAQDHHEMLTENENVFAWLQAQVSNKTDVDLRKTLARMLFTKDDIDKNVLHLSGGEGARLLLGNVVLQQGNVLVLDEPTNHLDIESIEALAQALVKTPATVLFVSHDRNFVDAVASRIIAITEHEIKDYHGSYREYLQYCGDDYLSREWLAK